jgi:hypothetical protein
MPIGSNEIAIFVTLVTQQRQFQTHPYSYIVSCTYPKIVKELFIPLRCSKYPELYIYHYIPCFATVDWEAGYSYTCFIMFLFTDCYI